MTDEVKEESKARVPFGFNPRSETDQMELSKGTGPGSATTERAARFFRRSPYYLNRGNNLTAPLEVQ